MKMNELTAYHKNLSLKREFKLLGLQLDQVMEFTPFDLDLENRRLEYLLEFVRKYEECGRHQETMYLLDYPFPPIFPGISPESDWYRFDLWLEGKPLVLSLWDQIGLEPPGKDPEQMSDEEVEAGLERILVAVDQADMGIGLVNELPPYVTYLMLVEYLAEDHDRIGGGGWVFDGCSGYCPDCLQRPWCETGNSSCWSEDEEAGAMYLREELKKFVSPSPRSLEILRELQRREDERFEAFQTDRGINGYPESN